MTKKKDEDKEFQEFETFSSAVEDIGCAAALSLAGFDPILITGGIPFEFSFIFQPTDGVRDMIASYHAGTLEVKACDYFKEIEILKSQVDDRRPGGVVYEEIKRSKEQNS